MRPAILSAWRLVPTRLTILLPVRVPDPSVTDVPGNDGDKNDETATDEPVGLISIINYLIDFIGLHDLKGYTAAGSIRISRYFLDLHARATTHVSCVAS